MPAFQAGGATSSVAACSSVDAALMAGRYVANVEIAGSIPVINFWRVQHVSCARRRVRSRVPYTALSYCYTPADGTRRHGFEPSLREFNSLRGFFGCQGSERSHFHPGCTAPPMEFGAWPAKLGSGGSIPLGAMCREGRRV